MHTNFERCLELVLEHEGGVTELAFWPPHEATRQDILRDDVRIYNLPSSRQQNPSKSFFGHYAQLKYYPFWCGLALPLLPSGNCEAHNVH